MVAVNGYAQNVRGKQMKNLYETTEELGEIDINDYTDYLWDSL